MFDHTINTILTSAKTSPKSQYTSIKYNEKMNFDLELLQMSKRQKMLSFDQPEQPKINSKLSQINNSLRVKTEHNASLKGMPDLQILALPDILKRSHKTIISYKSQDIRSQRSYDFNRDLPFVQRVKVPKAVPKIEKLSTFVEFREKNLTLRDIIAPLYDTPPQDTSPLSSQRKSDKVQSPQAQSGNIQMKFQKISNTPNDNVNLDARLWKVHKHVAKVNKAYLIQQQYFKDRIDEIWKPDAIQKQLQQKIIQNGTNVKSGLRQIYLILFAHQLEIQHTSQGDGAHLQKKRNFRVIEYFIPVYKKVHDYQEVLEDMDTWVQYLLEMLKIKQHNIRFFYLDGKPMKDLSSIPSYEKVIYVTMLGVFDFWQVIKAELLLTGEFSIKRYPKLAMRLFDIANKEDLQNYFAKRENFIGYFEATSIKKFEIQTINTQKLVHPTTPNEEPELNEQLYDFSIFHMNKTTQRVYLQAIQESLLKQRAKYSTKIDNVEQNLRTRISKIKNQRLQPLSPMRRALKQQQQEGLVLDEEDHYEYLLQQGDVDSIEDIKEEAQDKVHPSNIIITKKHRLQQQKKWIEDPFQLLSITNNKKFTNIINYINVEKIMCDKFLSRQDVITYLSLFKSLMDSDKLLSLNTPSQLASIYVPPIATTLNDSQFKIAPTQHDSQFKTAPTLYISLKQLRRAMPYLALYKQTINTKKLNDIFNTKYKCVGFMDFLDIFASNSEDLADSEEVLDNQAFM